MDAKLKKLNKNKTNVAKMMSMYIKKKNIKPLTETKKKKKVKKRKKVKKKY